MLDGLGELGELGERGELGTLRPGEPPSEQRSAVVALGLENRPHLLFDQYARYTRPLSLARPVRVMRRDMVRSAGLFSSAQRVPLSRPPRQQVERRACLL